jgi:hypothetical protein
LINSLTTYVHRRNPKCTDDGGDSDAMEFAASAIAAALCIQSGSACRAGTGQERVSTRVAKRRPAKTDGGRQHICTATCNCDSVRMAPSPVVSTYLSYLPIHRRAVRCYATGMCGSVGYWARIDGWTFFFPAVTSIPTPVLSAGQCCAHTSVQGFSLHPRIRTVSALLRTCSDTELRCVRIPIGVGVHHLPCAHTLPVRVAPTASRNRPRRRDGQLFVMPCNRLACCRGLYVCPDAR